jgi:hypothetical protein
MRELREERCRRKMQKALQHVEMTKCKTSMQIAKVGHELVEDRRTDTGTTSKAQQTARRMLWKE